MCHVREHKFEKLVEIGLLLSHYHNIIHSLGKIRNYNLRGYNLTCLFHVIYNKYNKDDDLRKIKMN